MRDTNDLSNAPAQHIVSNISQCYRISFHVAVDQRSERRSNVPILIPFYQSRRKPSKIQTPSSRVQRPMLRKCFRICDYLLRIPTKFLKHFLPSRRRIIPRFQQVKCRNTVFETLKTVIISEKFRRSRNFRNKFLKHFRNGRLWTFP